MNFDWGDCKTDPTNISDSEKAEIAWCLLTHAVYPPIENLHEKTAHNQRQRLRIRALQIAERIQTIDSDEKSKPSKKDVRKKLINEFEAIGGYGVVVRSYSLAYYYRSKVRKAWVKWCSIYAQYDLIFRAATLGIGFNRARFVVLQIPNYPFKILTNRDALISATEELKPISAILMGILSNYEFVKGRVPTLKELHEAVMQNFPRVIAMIIQYEKFLSSHKPLRSRECLIAESVMLKLPMKIGNWDDMASVPGALSAEEKQLIDRYDQDAAKNLTSNTNRSMYRENISKD